MVKIITVEDDSLLLETLIDQLSQEDDFDALGASTLAEGRQLITDHDPDLVLLDVMLPDGDGRDMCRWIRDQGYSMPILMLMGQDSEADTIEGLEAGANDYIAKPFNPNLLLARVKAVLSRAQRTSSLAYRRRIKTFGFDGWIYEGKHDEVRAPDGYQVALSQKETGLLKVFLANAHIPLTREEIADALDVTGKSDGTEATGRAIDVLVGRLRTKIEKDPKAPRLVRTARGVGYVFSVDVEVKDA